MALCRVLLGDDNLAFVDSARRHLAIDPSVVIVGDAQSRHAVLQQIALLQPHVLVLSVSLPGARGLELVRRIKTSAGAPAVVVLALDDLPDYRAEAMAVGADGFLAKSNFGAQALPLIHALFGDVSAGVEIRRSSFESKEQERQTMPKRTKRTAQPIHSGQLAGAQIKVGRIYNDGLREYITVVNRGTVPQPMSGWVLASLRGERFYRFPTEVIVFPGIVTAIYSGQGAQDDPPCALFWTEQQVWNNKGDVAVLFDANGGEVDYLAYPHQRILGRGVQRRRRLLHDGETWRVVDEPVRRADKPIRQRRIR